MDLHFVRRGKMTEQRPITSQRRRHEGGIYNPILGECRPSSQQRSAERRRIGDWDSGLYKVLPKNESKSVVEPGRYNREAHAQAQAAQARATPPSPVPARKSVPSQPRDDWSTQNSKTIPKRREGIVCDGPCTLKVGPRFRDLRES